MRGGVAPVPAGRLGQGDGVSTAVVVGSGPNGLAAALTLAGAGVRVQVIEAADELGGGLRSSELTLPGLLHDECAGFHPLMPGAEFTRTVDLSAEGLRWLLPEIQYAHPLDGGRGASAWKSVARTGADLGSADGRSWRRMFGPLADRFDTIGDEFLQPVLHVPAHPVHLARFGAYAALPASVLERRWRRQEARALFAGVAAHAFRPLDSPFTAAIGVALGAAAHRFGWPVAEGGSQAVADAAISAATRLGVTFATGHRVVSLAELGDPDIVMLDVAPAAAADIAGARMPARIARAYRAYRHGPAAFKVDFAVEGGVPWSYEPARRAGTVHLGGDSREIAAVEREISRGRMPERPFVLVGQQYVADPTRSRDDVHPLYAYAHVPAGFGGDATEAIMGQLERFAPGFRDRVRATAVTSTTDLTIRNPNYVGGDIATGANHAWQLVFRPRVTLDPYRTGVPGVYLCSAATPPGAGAHGMCGFNAANSALRRLARGA